MCLLLLHKEHTFQTDPLPPRRGLSMRGNSISPVLPLILTAPRSVVIVRHLLKDNYKVKPKGKPRIIAGGRWALPNNLTPQSRQFRRVSFSHQHICISSSYLQKIFISSSEGRRWTVLSYKATHGPTLNLVLTVNKFLLLSSQSSIFTLLLDPLIS